MTAARPSVARALDARGRPTTDPAAMFTDPRGAILPFGLHKGYGLALACELLAGALGGGGTLATVAPEPGRITNNLLSFVLDPGRLPGAGRAGEEMAAAVSLVKASPPADPAAPVLVAGEPERAARARRLASGIAVDGAAWDQLVAAGRSVGLALEGAVDGLAELERQPRTLHPEQRHAGVAHEERRSDLVLAAKQPRARERFPQHDADGE